MHSKIMKTENLLMELVIDTLDFKSQLLGINLRFNL